MGKKNKKEKKGQGKEKTLQKMEKKATKKSKKELAEKGEEDIEKLLADFQEQDRKKTQVIEEKCQPPSPRCNMSLTPHPDKDELIMFGGEYFTGNKMFLYNDLLFYNIRKNEWMKVSVPNGPPPRSAHQAVALKQEGGQLWVFGGEFASPTQSQFYHYKDLWVYHFKEKRWEKMSAPGGPSARSGHRMVHCKKQLIVFGGFHDNIRDYKYFNDVHAFNLDTYTWVQIVTSGIPPAARSACVMATLQDQVKVMVYGGYSKERVKKDVDVGKMHTDMYTLMPEGKVKEDGQPGAKWKWVSVKQSGSRPSPRSGLSLVVIPGNRAVCFGGVFDEEENEEQIKGKFFNSMYLVELDKGKWFDVELRGKRATENKKKRRKQKETADDNEDSDDENDDEVTEEQMDIGEQDIKKLKIDTSNTENDTEMKVTVKEGDGNSSKSGEGDTMETDNVVASKSEDSIFKVTIGPQSSTSVAENGSTAMSVDPVDVFKPSPRMNALLAMKNGQLFMYGGIYEDGDKQYTLSDFYSIDIHKMDSWNIIIENNLKNQVWEESDSSSDEEEMGEGAEGACGGDSEEDSDDEMDIDFSDAPEKPASESVNDYFVRTNDYWTSKAKEYCDSEDMKLSNKKLEKLAKEMCQEAFDS